MYGSSSGLQQQISRNQRETSNFSSDSNQIVTLNMGANQLKNNEIIFKNIIGNNRTN
jgi:hypothetical protein